MKTLDASQTDRLRSGALFPVNLIELRTFKDKSRLTVSETFYFATRYVLYNSLQWLPYLIGVRFSRAHLRHLPDPQDVGLGSLRKTLELELRNATDEAGVRLGRTLLDDVLENASVVWRELLVDPAGTEWDFSDLVGNEDTVRFRGDVAAIGAVSDQRITIACEVREPVIPWEIVSEAGADPRDLGARKNIVYGSVTKRRCHGIGSDVTPTTLTNAVSESNVAEFIVAATGLPTHGGFLVEKEWITYTGTTEFAATTRLNGTFFSRDLAVAVAHLAGVDVRVFGSRELFSAASHLIKSVNSVSIKTTDLSEPVLLSSRYWNSGAGAAGDTLILVDLALWLDELSEFRPADAARDPAFECFANLSGYTAPDGNYIAAQGVLMQKMPDILRHLIAVQAGLGHAVIDSAWDDVGGVAFLDDNKHHAVLADFGSDFIAILTRLAFESRCNLIVEERAAGQTYRLLAAGADYSWPSSGKTLIEWANVEVTGVDREARTTRSRSLYARDGSRGDSERAFTKSVVLTPDESTLIRPSAAQLERAEEIFGRRDAPAQTFLSIDDQATMEDVAGYYAFERTRSTPIAREVTIDDSPYVESFDVEQGDLLNLVLEWDPVAVVIRVTDVVHDSVRQMNLIRGVIVHKEQTFDLEFTQGKLDVLADFNMGNADLVMDSEILSILGGGSRMKMIHTTPTSTSPLLGGFFEAQGGQPLSQGAHVCSLIFDGTEGLSSASDQTIGIANAWSIQIPFRFDNSATGTQPVLDIRGTTLANSIRLETTTGGPSLEVLLYDSAGTLFKRYLWQLDAVGGGASLSNFEANDWGTITLTWNGTNLLLYWNGVARTPEATTTDDAGTMTDTARRIFIAQNRAGTTFLAGRIHSLAIWDVVLSASEAAAIFNHGAIGWFDLARTGLTDYAQSANLKHWHRLGKDPASLGRDFVTASSRDLSTAVGGVAAANLRADGPDACYIPFGAAVEATLNSDSLGSAAGLLGIADVWTIMLTAYIESVTQTGTLLDIFPASGSDDQINFSVLESPDRLEVLLSDSSGFFWQQWWPLPPLQEWQSIFLVWDGSGSPDTLRLWRQGELIEPIGAAATNAGSLANVSRQIRFGLTNSSGLPFDGRLHSCALWDVVLPDVAIRDLWYGGKFNRDLAFDRSSDEIGYKQSGDLQHWWIFGQPASSSYTGGPIATDRVTSGGVDIEVLTTDVPAGGRLNTGTEDRKQARGTGSGVSIRLNGTDEYLREPRDRAYEDNIWASVWFLPDALVGSQTVLHSLPEQSGASTDDDGALWIHLDEDVLVVQLADSFGRTNKHFRVESLASASVWNHLLFTYKDRQGGSDGILLLYFNGALLAASAITKVDDLDGGLSVADRRQVWIGRHALLANSFFKGLIARPLFGDEANGADLPGADQAAEIFAGRSAIDPRSRGSESLDAHRTSIARSWNFSLMGEAMDGDIGSSAHASTGVGELLPFSVFPSENLVIGNAP